MIGKLCCDKCGQYTDERQLDFIRLTAEDFLKAMQYLPNGWDAPRDDNWDKVLGGFCVQCANEFNPVRHVIDNYNNPLPSGAVIEANFSIEGSPSIAGFHNPLKRWNGWAMPYFTIDGVRKIMNMNSKLAADYPDTYDTFEITKAGVIWKPFDGEEDNIEVFPSSQLRSVDIWHVVDNLGEYTAEEDDYDKPGILSYSQMESNWSSHEVWSIGAGCWVWDAV